VRILDERREALVERERELLERLVSFLKDFGAPSEDIDLVRRAHQDLEELFLLVIVGEFNSGKSAFVNALLGADISEEGVTPTTDRDSLRRRLGEVVRRQFEVESNRSVERMREAIGPYTRFVRSEHARMTRAGEDLAALDAETRALKDEISAPGVGPKTSL
jgi:energy-coupling factor transporter ATP-binding protein EcfA2